MARWCLRLIQSADCMHARFQLADESSNHFPAMKQHLLKMFCVFGTKVYMWSVNLETVKDKKFRTPPIKTEVRCKEARHVLRVDLIIDDSEKRQHWLKFWNRGFETYFCNTISGDSACILFLSTRVHVILHITTECRMLQA